MSTDDSTLARVNNMDSQVVDNNLAEISMEELAKRAGPASSLKSVIKCTVCRHNVIPNQKLFQHPKLKILLCKSCFYTHRKCKAFVDEESNPAACYLCGKDTDDDASLMCCDHCDYAFHESCIKNNVSEEYFDKIKYIDEWACLACDPSPIEELQKWCILNKDRLVVIRNPFLSPNSKMPPKIATGRCIENVLFSAKTLRDRTLDCRKFLSSKDDSDDFDDIYEKLKECLLSANEQNNRVLKVLQKLQDNQKKLNESSNTNSSVAFLTCDTSVSEKSDLDSNILNDGQLSDPEANIINDNEGNVQNSENADEISGNKSKKKLNPSIADFVVIKEEILSCDDISMETDKDCEDRLKRKAKPKQTAKNVCDDNESINQTNNSETGKDDDTTLEWSSDVEINEKYAQERGTKCKRNYSSKNNGNVKESPEKISKNALDIAEKNVKRCSNASEDKEDFFSDFEYNPTVESDILNNETNDLEKKAKTTDSENVSKNLLSDDENEKSASSRHSQFELPKLGMESDMDSDGSSNVTTRISDHGSSTEIKTPSSSATVEFRTPGQSPICELETASSTATVEIRTPDRSPTTKLETSSSRATVEIRTPDRSPTSDLETSSISATFEIRTPDRNPATELKTPSCSANVEMKTPERRPTTELKTPSCSANVEMKTPYQSPSAELGTPSSSATAEMKTPDRSSTDEIKTPDRSSTDEMKTPDRSSTDEMKTPDRSSTDELKTYNSSTTVEMKSPDRSPSGELETPSSSATVELGTLEGSSRKVDIKAESYSESDKLTTPSLRLSLSKKIKKKDERSENSEKQKKTSAKRSIVFDSEVSSSGDENDKKAEVVKDDETNKTTEDDLYVKQRNELLKAMEDSESDESKNVDNSKGRRLRSKTKPVELSKTSRSLVENADKRKTNSSNSKTSKVKKLQNLLKCSLSEASDDEGMYDSISRRKQEKHFILPTLDDPKLRMDVKLEIKKLTDENVNFILVNGVKEWRKRQRRQKSNLSSSDEEFIKMCDISRVSRKKTRTRTRNGGKTSHSSEEKGECSTKQKKSSSVKETKDDIALMAVDTSESEESEDGVKQSTKSSRLSSESEPEFKSANELARERLLKELASSSSGDSGDFGSGEDVRDEKKKKRSKEKEKKDSEKKDIKEEKPAKANDSDDDFIPTRRLKTTRSKTSKHIASDSDSDDSIVLKKKRGGKSRDSDSGKLSTASSSSNSRKRKLEGGKSSKKKRRRIKVASSSNDSSVEELSASENMSSTPGSRGRKNIRKLISDRKLASDTKVAAREEDERRKRVTELQKLYNEVQRKEEISGNKVTTKLILASDKNETLEINEALVCKLKPHQIEGVKFMWECTGETLERLDTTHGSGCILAHCMGLGKTLQVITFLHTILTREKGNIKTALVVSPLNTVLNWYRECEMWLDDVRPSIMVMEMSSYKTTRERISVLNNWKADGGILIIGYDNFRNLLKENKKIPKLYRDQFNKHLLDPGPDIVVCDEGHILKNSNTGISKAMSRIGTLRRIILTGTPLQNNLTEYHCMVSFVKPNLLGTMKEFQNRFVNPINNGQHNDSTQSDVRVMKHRAHVLYNLLGGCVQRKDYNVLTPFLPPKHEYVLSIGLTAIQKQLYSYYLENLCSRLHGKGQLFTDYQSLMKIWTHPRVIRLSEIRQELKKNRTKGDGNKLIQKHDNTMPVVANYDSEDAFINDDSDSSSEDSNSNAVILEDSDDEPGTSSKRKKDSDSDEVISNRKTRSRSNKFADRNETEQEEKDVISEPINTWWSTFISEEDAKKVELSGKMIILFDILKQCEEIDDKVLLFSQSLLSLDFIESILNGEEPVTSMGTDVLSCIGQMVRGIDYFRLDGSTNADMRSKFIKSFNDENNTRARLFLISTKAGSLGTNLVAANRVIIFDASWNPTHDIQSIFRVYRFGQIKPVYVYRLLAHGTMEDKIYQRQVTKQSLACRVIDEQQIERHFSHADLQELYAFEPDNVKNIIPLLPKDKLLADLIIKRKELIMSYHEHDSLLVNQAEEELSEEERCAAWVEYKFEKQALEMEGIRIDIHALIQTIQRQNPGLNEQELADKVNAACATFINEAREKKLQRQLLQQQQQQMFLQQQQLLQQQQQQFQQLQQQQKQPFQQQQFQHQVQQQLANLSNMSQLFGQNRAGLVNGVRLPGHGNAFSHRMLNPGFSKVNTLPPKNPFP